MKQLKLLLLFIIPFHVFAQDKWNVVIDDSDYNYSQLKDAIVFQDSILLVSGLIRQALCRDHRLFAYDFNGKLLWTIDGVHDGIAVDSDYIYTTGLRIPTHTNIEKQLVISKYDRNGKKVFSKDYLYKPRTMFYFGEMLGATFKNDGSAIAYDNTFLAQVDTQGLNFQKVYQTSNDSIRGVIKTDSTYLIYTTYDIFKLDEQFKPILKFNRSPLIYPINKVYENNDTIYVLNDKKLIRLDENLKYLDIYFTHTDTIRNIAFEGNSIWLNYYNNTTEYLIELQNGKVIDSASFPLMVNQPEYVYHKNHHFFIGRSFDKQIGIYCYENPSGAYTENQPDIELLNIEIKNIDYIIFSKTDTVGYRFNPILTVRNNGTDTIKSLAAYYSPLGAGTECAPEVFEYHKIEGLEILPNQTAEVLSPKINDYSTISINFCTRLMAPNSELELKRDNNYFCEKFINLSENEVQLSQIKIYPNPATDYLMLHDASRSNKKIEIIDISGKIIYSSVQSSQKIKISTAEFSKGVYILKVQTNNQETQKLFIKE